MRRRSLAARNCVPCALRSTSGNELTYRAKTRIDSVCIAAVCPSVAISRVYVRVYVYVWTWNARAYMHTRGVVRCSRRRAPPAAGGRHRVHEREHATEFRGAISFRRRGHFSRRRAGEFPRTDSQKLISLSSHPPPPCEFHRSGSNLDTRSKILHKYKLGQNYW